MTASRRPVESMNLRWLRSSTMHAHSRSRPCRTSSSSGAVARSSSPATCTIAVFSETTAETSRAEALIRSTLCCWTSLRRIGHRTDGWIRSWSAPHPAPARSSTDATSTPARGLRRRSILAPRRAVGADPSGLRDLASEGLERDGVGLRATAAAGIERVDRGHLVRGELEVEDVDVLGDAAGLGGLRDDRAPVLDAPAQHDLGGGLAVRRGDAADHSVLEGAGVLAIAIERDSADR